MNNKANNLNQKIKQLPEVEMYLKLKEEIKNNKELNDLYKQTHDLQLKLKEAAQNNSDNYSILQKQLEEKKQLFMNHPLIVNYYFYKEETLNIIEQINQIIK